MAIYMPKTFSQKIVLQKLEFENFSMIPLLSTWSIKRHNSNYHPPLLYIPLSTYNPSTTTNELVFIKKWIRDDFEKSKTTELQLEIFAISSIIHRDILPVCMKIYFEKGKPEVIEQCHKSRDRFADVSFLRNETSANWCTFAQRLFCLLNVFINWTFLRN